MAGNPLLITRARMTIIYHGLRRHEEQSESPELLNHVASSAFPTDSGADPGTHLGPGGRRRILTALTLHGSLLDTNLHFCYDKTLIRG